MIELDMKLEVDSNDVSPDFIGYASKMRVGDKDSFMYLGGCDCFHVLNMMMSFLDSEEQVILSNDFKKALKYSKNRIKETLKKWFTERRYPCVSTVGGSIGENSYVFNSYLTFLTDKLGKDVLEFINIGHIIHHDIDNFVDLLVYNIYEEVTSEK